MYVLHMVQVRSVMWEEGRSGRCLRSGKGGKTDTDSEGGIGYATTKSKTATTDSRHYDRKECPSSDVPCDSEQVDPRTPPDSPSGRGGQGLVVTRPSTPPPWPPRLRRFITSRRKNGLERD